MAAESEVIKEFLVSLGFKVDEVGGKKFRTSLNDTTKSAMAVSGAVIGIGVAIEKFVDSMTENLSKLFYISQRTGATVGGLKATAAGFEAVGLSAEQSQQAIEALGHTLRLPWLRQQLSGFGINVNQKTENVEQDIEHKLAQWYNLDGAARQMAFNFGKQWLGLDEGAITTLVKNLPENDKRRGEYNQRLAESGVDLDASAKDAAEFRRELGLIGTDFSMLANQVLPKLMPTMHSFAQDLESIVHDLVKANAEMPRQTGFFKKFWQAMTGQAITEVDTDAAATTTGDKELDEYYKAHPDKRPGAERKADVSGLQAAARAAAMQYGLNPEEFMAQIQTESHYDPTQKSKAGAVGVAQFMPGTARERGFEAGQDPIKDIQEAARFMHEMMVNNGWDQKRAEIGYNAGPNRKPGEPGYDQGLQYVATIERNMASARVGSGAPGAANKPEGASGGSKTFAPNITNNFTVSGTDASNTAAHVKTIVARSNDDLVRDGQSILAH